MLLDAIYQGSLQGEGETNGALDGFCLWLLGILDE